MAPTAALNRVLASLDRLVAKSNISPQDAADLAGDTYETVERAVFDEPSPPWAKAAWKDVLDQKVRPSTWMS